MTDAVNPESVPSESQPADALNPEAVTPIPVSSQGAPVNPHSTIALHPSSCTSCMLCVRECPDWCISIEAHSEPDPDAPAYSNARRQSMKNVLDTFTIDFGQCMWCGICIEVCPFDALFWSENLMSTGTSRDQVIFGIDELAASLPGARRADGTLAPAIDEPPSGRRKKA